jgi:hypothetical protein
MKCSFCSASQGGVTLFLSTISEGEAICIDCVDFLQDLYERMLIATDINRNKIQPLMSLKEPEKKPKVEHNFKIIEGGKGVNSN